ncbi:MAG: hypothetical protein H6Q73_87 [Firmicutes bacterium]|nr:hypothetical protein [Bacillota bacterium]
MSEVNILNYLETVSNQNLWLNFSIHLLVIIAVSVILFSGKRNCQHRIVDGVILLLFTSVAVNAVVYGNPFHFITFAFLAIFAILELYKSKNEFYVLNLNVRCIVAITFVIIGFWYPEFVKTTPAALILFSPAGIIPCPTLLITLGMLTLAYPKVNMTQYTITALLGFCYGLIGVFKLNVSIDVALILLAGYALYCIGQSWLRRLKGKKNVYYC